MDSKLKYELDHTIPNFSMTKIEQAVMHIWQDAAEGSKLYRQCEELTQLIHQKQDELGELKDLALLLANKL